MTNRLILVVALWATGCKQQRDVYIQMGPQPGQLSEGFKCQVDAMNDMTPLLLEGAPGDPVQLSLVIDLVDLGDRLPGCRGEDLIRACSSTSGSCALLETGSTRYCHPLTLSARLISGATNEGDDAPLLAAIKDQLSGEGALRVTANTPDRPMLVRVTITKQACTEIQDGRMTLMGSAAVGCAYSCPFVADTITGSISVGLDALTKKCGSAVRACAGFSPR